MKISKKIELLAPAGNFSKMKYAFFYGADAVYLGMPDFSLRTKINHFNESEIKKSAQYAHNLKKKIYVTINIYARNEHIFPIKKHLIFLRKIKVDGIIASDPGVISLVKKYLPGVDIHLSTQANTVNFEAVSFWKNLGIKRIILARELEISEIKEIKKKVPKMELEVFVHGAMCISYSGRCLLSQWMSGRNANLGDCSQPCRWAYFEKQIGAEKKIKEMNFIDNQKKFEIKAEEDRHGTYFFNSYDLNLIEHLSELVDAGVDSFKIEGRAKSVYYLAITARAYRKVLCSLEKNFSQAKMKKEINDQKKELKKLVHRGYTEGFLLGGDPLINFFGKMEKSDWEFAGEVLGEKNGFNVLKVHNAVFLESEIEAITPQKNLKIKIEKILNENMEKVREAHGGHNGKYYFKFSRILPEMSLIIRKKPDNFT